MKQADFTKDEIFDHAVGNAGGLWYTTIMYLKSKGLNVAEWVEFVGKDYAPGWDELRGKGALEVLRMAALNWVSCGGKLISLDGDESKAEAVLEWPPEDWSGVPTQEAHIVNNVFHPITKQVGLKCTWKSEGNQFRLIFFKE